MLNEKGERELVYVVKIDDIIAIPGADNVELAAVGGWRILVKKNQFHPGDPAIYFEIDSQVPETEPFLFLAPKHFKIKTQKYFKGTVISQGLLMHAEDFGWKFFRTTEYKYADFPETTNTAGVVDNDGVIHFEKGESRFLTQKLGVIYAETNDNQRKAAPADKYKIMAQRQGKLFSHQPYRWLMKRDWGKKILFLFYGKKRDKKSSWPVWVKKTDEERIQNMPWILTNKDPWIATEKIDGSSTTFTIKRKYFGKYDFFVCSRNVVFDEPDKKCYYDTNIYLEMAEKYDMKSKMKELMDTYFSDCNWLTIQGETYGAGVQKRDYSTQEHGFMAFNLIDSKRGRWNTLEMKKFLEQNHGIPCVPIVDRKYILPDTVEEILRFATGVSKLDGKSREGIVFRSLDGSQSFKAVSNEFLMKYHS